MSPTYILDQYKPRVFMRTFEDIARIPHGSGEEAGVARYIMDFARDCGLIPEPDEHGNVLIRMPASAGCGQIPPVLFQAHMDMVCAKDPGVKHDFSRDPLELFVAEGDVLYARGTTLGADNAVGLCLMLGLMREEPPVHPPIEFLFTVEEETGLFGMRKFDFSKLKARRMINMDCGDADMICVCGSGAAHDCITLPLRRCGYEGLKCALSVTNLVGGHSGLRIGEGRANGITLLGRLLQRLVEDCGVRIERVDSPETSGIPTDCTAVVMLPAGGLGAAQAAAADLQQALREEYGDRDPNITFTLESYGEGAMQVLEPQCAQSLVKLLCGIAYGVTHWDEDGESVITSSCTFRLATLEDRVEIGYSIRSAIDSEKWAMQDDVAALAKDCGADIELTDHYAGWPIRPDSPIQDLCRRTYRELFGAELKTEKAHGGIEPGIAIGALPDMDAMGIAPTGRGAHTTTEHLYLREVEPVWELLRAMLERMCRGS